MKAIKYILILTASSFILNSCTKQVTGPTGPTGAQGPQGPSSSYYTMIDSVETGSHPGWAYNGSDSVSTFTISPINALISPNTSIVDVYYSNSHNAFSTWLTLPKQNVWTQGDLLDYYYSTYSVSVYYFNPNGGPPVSSWIYFKIVIISNP